MVERGAVLRGGREGGGAMEWLMRRGGVGVSVVGNGLRMVRCQELFLVRNERRRGVGGEQL